SSSSTTSTTSSSSTTTTTTSTSTTTPTSTKPGKGCGDKNHLHERRFECKIVISGVSAKEGNSGVKSFVFTASLSGWPESPVTVDYATSNGSATAGSDYTATSGTLKFLSGQSVAYVSVP